MCVVLLSGRHMQVHARSHCAWHAAAVGRQTVLGGVAGQHTNCKLTRERFCCMQELSGADTLCKDHINSKNLQAVSGEACMTSGDSGLRGILSLDQAYQVVCWPDTVHGRAACFPRSCLGGHNLPRHIEQWHRATDLNLFEQILRW